MSYISVEEFQKYSNTFSDNIDLQQSYIDSAEDIVENYLGYSPTYKQYSSILNGSGTLSLVLKAKPIQSILQVLVDNVPVSLNNFTIDNETIYSNIIFPIGEKNIKVWYFAGFTNTNEESDEILDGGNASSVYEDDTNYDIFDSGGANTTMYKMPNIIKLTVLRIASLLQTESDSNIGVTSKSFGESGTRTFVNFTNFNKHLLPISKYKLLVI